MHQKNEYEFDPDWKAIFVKDFCRVCKKRNTCPDAYECKDLVEFVELNENVHNGDSSEKIRP